MCFRTYEIVSESFVKLLGMSMYFGSKVFGGSTECVGFILGGHIDLAEAKVTEGKVT